jgi:tRNA A37 threonylcarbamoyladenosine biosynthesis protein TsaE
MLESMPERILLVLTDNELDAIPWEYAFGPEGYLVLEYHFVRGLPINQRIPTPTLDCGLHIVAVPSDPLSIKVDALNIDGEWLRLQEIIQGIPYALTLERTRPPTIEQLRYLLANQHNRVMHFMGHGGQDATGAFLCFEQENGDLEPVTVREFVSRVRRTVFLVTVNACASAAPGPALFSNLIAALARQKVPYALGMRLSIYDDDARVFSRTFYSDLASGTPVEEALLQARLTLAKSSRPWSIGVPILYTALTSPDAGFTSLAGTPTIKEHQPHIEIEGSALPRSQGIFQGRIEELKELGKKLTGDSRSQILTIHGGGGQGKTALAREAIERFAHAWPGGVWATSLEHVPERETFVNQLAHFLRIDTQQVLDPSEVERLVLTQVSLGRKLIVLDNAETLIEAVERKDKVALDLVQLITQLPGPTVSLLVTSRRPLEWSGEVSFELGGLAPEDGAQLFRECVPNRIHEIEPVLAKELSEKLKGHPLALRLLSAAFNSSSISLRAFLLDCDAHLVRAANKYLDIEHRHRTLNACIEISVRYLDADLRALLSGLWVFHAPFLSEEAVVLFEPEHEDTEESPSSIHERLYTLWQRSLLTREIITVRDGMLTFYYLLPTTRPDIEHHLEQAYERETILPRFGEVYAELADFIYDELDNSAVAVAIAKYAHEDLEQGKEHVQGMAQGSYLLEWGWILYRLGSTQRGLTLLEHALEIVEREDKSLESTALNNIAAC